MTAATGSLAGGGALEEALARRRLRDEIVSHRWQLAKQTTWLTLLTVSFLIFYLLDVMQDSMILAMARY